jgi:hypothetical protein
VLYTFQQRLPLEETPDLASRWDYFYERSIGCVGILKDWLTRSLALALEAQSSTLCLKYIEQRALSIAQCNAILSEAIIYEKELEERDGGQESLRKRLGLEAKPSQDAQTTISPSDTKQSPNISPTRHKGRVGVRNPKRDKIGVKVA